MANKTCAAFLFEGFIDHQLALALACLNRNGDYGFETFSAGKKPLTSATGYKVLPHASLPLMDPDDFDILLLPGGTLWEKGDNLEIFPLIAAVAGKKPIIAIGEAALALADLGLLDEIAHTSLHPGYIQRFCPEYSGSVFYRQQPIVSAGRIITVGPEALLPAGHGMLGLFDTLQKIYANTHELFDQE